MVVGARDDDDYGSASGSAYVFEWNGSAWVQQTKLAPADGAASDWFGYSVSISGDRLAASTRNDDVNGSLSGSVYTYSWDGSGWVQQPKLTPDDAGPGDWFGESVSLVGDRLVVSALYDTPSSVYVFEWNGTAWDQQAKLTAGAEGDDDNGSESGSAYVFADASVPAPLAVSLPTITPTYNEVLTLPIEIGAPNPAARWPTCASRSRTCASRRRRCWSSSTCCSTTAIRPMPRSTVW